MTVTSINCTSCGAGLDVFGGGRVLSQACGYCGAVLDAQDNYKVLAKYENLTRPDTPFRLGDQGKIAGVAFTVIGIKQMTERYGGRVWTWVDHQVFSPTHGYGWLTPEDGHLVWSRKSRHASSVDWITPAGVERAESRPKTEYRGATYIYYETSTAQITYLEGEFNWIPKIGDRSTAISLLGPRGMIAFRQNGAEREIEESQLLPPETWASFGIDMPRPHRVHPAQIYVPSPHQSFLRNLFAAGLAVATIGAITIMGMGGPVQQLGAYRMNAIPESVPFEVSDPSRPVQIGLRTDLSNNWAFFGVEVNGPDGETLFETGREISFYSGGRGDDAWTEGSRSSYLRFMPQMAGTHTVSVSLEEAPGIDMLARGTIRIDAQDRRTNGLWLGGVAIAFLLALFATFAGSNMHQKRRFSGSDWTDED